MQQLPTMNSCSYFWTWSEIRFFNSSIVCDWQWFVAQTLRPCLTWWLPRRDYSERAVHLVQCFLERLSNGRDCPKWKLAFRWLLRQLSSHFIVLWHLCIFTCSKFILFRFIPKIMLHVKWSSFWNTHENRVGREWVIPKKQTFFLDQPPPSDRL